MPVTPLIAESAIQRRVAELGRTIAAEYRGRPLTVLGVLTGSIVFLSDLIRAIEIPLRVGLLQASSYRGATTVPGRLELGLDLLPELQNRDVLLVDDIFDTGRTLAAVCDALRQREPKSLRSAVLLWKQGRAEVAIRPDYYGFQIPDQFVVGYGLDYNDEYRHLPYIGVLEP